MFHAVELRKNSTSQDGLRKGNFLGETYKPGKDGKKPTNPPPCIVTMKSETGPVSYWIADHLTTWALQKLQLL
jgi:hypothetical protein